VAKRLFDLAIALGALFLLWPLFALIAVWIRLDSPGPALFAQKRVGENGRSFKMIKFRTMVADAERLGPPEDFDELGRRTYKTRQDARVTRAGRWLRRLSLDELPQLFNVLKGEMSLVGPRPEIPEIVAQYPPEYHRRHEVRPGIAGLAQVNGRSDLTYDETATYDLRYVDNHSVLTDLSILLRTIFRVAIGSGAR
jgi:lipopolysaccharide/colanic/teichoic acid biosynthesis glycosyltransferase